MFLKKDPIKYVIIFLVILILSSCVTSEYLESDITIATHPSQVANMKFITGYSSTVGTAWSWDEICRMAANNAAEAGYRNITVLIEMLDQGQFPSQNNYGTWGGGRSRFIRVSFYQ